MIQVQNVTIFPEKREFQISRGRHITWAALTQGGVLVVKIKGFDRYWFDPDTASVYAKQARGGFRLLKQHTELGKAFFWLYLNGHKTKIYMRQILDQNMKGVERFSEEGSAERDNLKLVS